MLPFNFHHLYYFYVIAQRGSVTAAARELRLSQPALSFQLKQIENYLEVQLFKREGRKLVLTEEGHSALSYARQIFDAGKEFADGLRDRSQKGRIRIQIGILDSIPKTFASALLQFILASDPSAHVQLQERTFEEMMQNLKDHFLDVVLADRPFQASVEDKIHNQLIARIPVVFCAHPALARKHPKIPRDLHNAPMIFPTADSRVFHQLQEYLAAHRITPRIVAEIQDIELAHRMAVKGLGIVPLNRQMALETPGKQLVILRQTGKPEVHESLYLISKIRKTPHPLVEKIIQGFSLQ